MYGNNRSSHQKCSIKNAVLKNFAVFTGKHPVFDSLFNKVAGFQACKFIKKRLKHRCFPANIANFKNIYFQEQLRMTAFVISV